MITRIDIGHDAEDESHAVVSVSAEDEESLQRLLMRLQTRGATRSTRAGLGLPRRAGRRLPRRLLLDDQPGDPGAFEGKWLMVDNPEMDCGLVYDDSGESPRFSTLPMADVKAGMQVVCGADGIKVEPPLAKAIGESFGFMESDVSSEKPQAVLVRQVAEGMREAKAAGEKVLWVGGPAVVHTGAAPAMVALVRAGYVNVLFAGNALATHDIESALYGTSLGVDLAVGRGVEHGHDTTSGRSTRSASAARPGRGRPGRAHRLVMHALVTEGKSFVLVGSVRDDGPLPDVYTDVIDGQRRCGRAPRCRLLPDGGDDAALGSDRQPLPLVPSLRRHQPGHRHQARRPRLLPGRGIVTDVGLFLEQLAHELVPSYRRA